MLNLFVLSFVVSLVAAFFILRGRGFHSSSRDTALPGTHKIHEGAVPRIGGISIFLGWLAGLAASVHTGEMGSLHALNWVLCLLPVFAAGVVEDFTKRVGVRLRFLLSLVSAALAYGLLGIAAVRIDVPGSEALLAVPVLSFALTLLAIGGIAHAVNIIDGLHGLALSICIMAFGAMAYVAFQVGDREVVLLCGIGAAAALGLRMWNYPSGEIFCGDGGAYFIGGYLSMLAGLLVGRNSEVSAWFPVLTLFYPIWETLFSAYRRKFVQGVPVSSADQLHLHTLLYASLLRGAEANGPSWRTRRNSDASHLLVLLALVNVLPALLWWNHTPYLLASALGFVLVYLLLYRRFAVPAQKSRFARPKIRIGPGGT